MLIAVLSGFILAAASPWLARSVGDRAGWLLAALPAALFVYFLGFLPTVNESGAQVIHYPWIPDLDVNFSFLVDGLSLLFALLISGIGTFIIIYAGGYLHGHPHLPRFYAIMFAFMASMLGLVLSNNLITLFVFWELTSVTSYLLMGFNHEDKNARWCALQGLLVTVAGGLALMAGLIMIGVAAGSFELHEILADDDVLREHPWYVGMLILVLIGSFAKSAQVPLHFWLPNAMVAPTPVSAFLHSATMVKAGVYLLARFNPGLGGTDAWLYTLGIVGALTMFTGSFMALRSTGIKAVLAYTTVMALGTLVMLIGIGTEGAIIAAMAFLLAHALYKASLFMLAGALDHETGTKDILKMGGLRQLMPITFLASCVAALSLAGLPPLFGFIAKELMFEATVGAPGLAFFTTVLAVVSAMMVAGMAAVFAIRPFTGKLKETPKKPHEAPPSMLAGPVVLATLGLLFGLMGFIPASGIVQSAVGAVYGSPIEVELYLWHGINLPLMLSILAIAGGVALFLRWEQVLDFYRERLGFIDRFGAERGYEKWYDGVVWLAEWQTRVLQSGYLRTYLTITVLTTVVLTGWTFFGHTNSAVTLGSMDMHFYEVAIAGVVVVGAIAASVTSSRIGAAATLGMVGFGVAMIYVLFSAPDLGITQIMIETLTVILLVLVLFRLPGFLNLSKPADRVRDAAVAFSLGTLMTVLILAVNGVTVTDPISLQLAEWSYTEAQGRNIVNVILVDFRALDTLGELFVIGLAAVGVYAMIRLRAEDKQR
ncbi:putative monovalent cation/H+ antiporter subunit A [Methylonatrum kenyense]|uniref:putative monovalent cation/H+ antiporter subunit A n=1 Tax=Methylonatrum kenyense TaxID=455253 RepID=UPI0020BE8CFB|nr:putative monovalent cation/H+ antiporter subunit A [Methylonatrum kenyense]MCK8517099.1 putative monovalent cation/H+ antiporter subunit A [Methylonatrum kenyense]